MKGYKAGKPYQHTNPSITHGAWACDIKWNDKVLGTAYGETKDAARLRAKGIMYLIGEYHGTAFCPDPNR